MYLGCCNNKSYYYMGWKCTIPAARDVQPMLFYCWTSVADDGPTVKQHWANFWDCWQDSPANTTNVKPALGECLVGGGGGGGGACTIMTTCYHVMTESLARHVNFLSVDENTKSVIHHYGYYIVIMWAYTGMIVCVCFGTVSVPFIIRNHKTGFVLLE